MHLASLPAPRRSASYASYPSPVACHPCCATAHRHLTHTPTHSTPNPRVGFACLPACLPGSFRRPAPGIVSIIAWSAFFSALLFWSLKRLGFLRVDQATELAGLDNMEHGGPGAQPPWDGGHTPALQPHTPALHCTAARSMYCRQCRTSASRSEPRQRLLPRASEVGIRITQEGGALWAWARRPARQLPVRRAMPCGRGRALHHAHAAQAVAGHVPQRAQAGGGSPPPPCRCAHHPAPPPSRPDPPAPLTRPRSLPGIQLGHLHGRH